MKYLITDNKQAKNQADFISPRFIVTRDESKDIDINLVDDIILDGVDTDILNRFTECKTMKYSETPLDYSDVEKLNAGIIALKKYERQVQKLSVGDFIMGCENSTQSNLSVSTPLDSEELVDLTIDEQIEILEPIFERNKKLGAGTLAMLSANMVNMSRANGFFFRDTTTGMIRTCFSRKPLIPELEAYTIFQTHFSDRLALKVTQWKTDKNTGDTVSNDRYVALRRPDFDVIWKNICGKCTFNSRKELYDAIPEWDGEPRIKTFMKDYFNCDTNPNFFLLLLTCIIGKIHNPTKAYTPYFFDVVSKSKGIGKTLLWSRLVGQKYVGDIKMNTSRGMSDFFVDCYDGNNIIVVDDECKWCGKGLNQINHDQFKNLVTAQVDKFSRKYGQPEVHDRCFVIVRTSNLVQQVYEPDERRQIIFKCNLEQNECRIKNLPDSFFQQLMAEAKEYYKKNGVYELTDSDRMDVIAANVDNFNYDSVEMYAITDYIEAVRSNKEIYGAIPAAKKLQCRTWGSYRKYTEYCKEEKIKPLSDRQFWRLVDALSKDQYYGISVISDAKVPLKKQGKSRIFEVLATINNDDEETDNNEDWDLEDMPY